MIWQKPNYLNEQKKKKKKKKSKRNGVEEGCFEKIGRMNMNTR
jgi:hypothetical protein